ncbi:MAG: HslU--HslV peptidase ATPase subunit [Legionellales bacterium]|nr:HslU--HslV peptidase ATPase subunit [Legionellales bacterium]OUX65038.1 MAG: HslU--HslV peptidase ATPase subunit [Gammaproteobacteria bacterium TMED281]
MTQTLTPQEIVTHLDEHVIGQPEAKKAIAVAVRNRYRRMNSSNDIQNEIMPNNILLIGPTGVGKTELVNRLVDTLSAPLLKVEATKFTEVGYVGRDVESIARDLAEKAFQLLKRKKIEEAKIKANDQMLVRILDAILPGTNDTEHLELRNEYKAKIISGEIDDQEVEININKRQNLGIEIMSPPGMEEMTEQIQGLFQSMNSGKKEKKKTKIKDAKTILVDEEAEKLIDESALKRDAITYAENEGIVFIDEIDKVVRSSSQSSGDVSREGVQRDLLPLIEGTIVNTKYGQLKTDHILFVASGAFMDTSPSDLISELQGRLPIQVELNKLTLDDLILILTQPKYSLIKQYQALLSTDKVKLQFTKDGIYEIALAAFTANENLENIGARRLNNVMESLLRNILFDAPFDSSKTFKINRKFVQTILSQPDFNDNWRAWVI